MGPIPPSHSIRSNLPYDPFSCSTCQFSGFKCKDAHDNGDIAELQTNPKEPVYINHAASLLSSVDLDESVKGSRIRDAASRTEATLALRVVLSSVLRSPSFSPFERAEILRNTRGTISQEYHLPGTVLDEVLSEPFHSLDGLTPLEFEIQNWGPIWESHAGDGMGMEVIRFLIERWRRRNAVTDSHELARGPNGEVLDPRIELVGLVRRACIRRLHNIPSNSTAAHEYTTNEDIANTLFQRIVGFIWSQNAGEENGLAGMGQRLPAIGANDYEVSVTPDLSAAKQRSMSLPSSCLTRDVDQGTAYNALVSIRDFASQLYKAERSGEDIPAGIRQRTSDVRRHQNAGIRHHPYGRPLHRLQQDQELAATPTLPPDPVDQGSVVSPRLLLIEFIAARRAWTLAIGRDELGLTLHEQELYCKLDAKGDLEPSCKDANSFMKSNVYAEVRLIAPTPERSPTGGEVSDEHVFTFPTMLPFGSVQNKDADHGSPRTSRISPCFSTERFEAVRSLGKSPVYRFDDPRLLHTGELLLELRVRIQPSPDNNLLEPISTLDYISENQSACTASSELDGYSWSAISVPLKSGTPSGVVSIDSSGVMSAPPGTMSYTSTESSWVRI